MTVSDVEEADDGDPRWAAVPQDPADPLTESEEHTVAQHLDDAEVAMLLTLAADVVAPPAVVGEWTNTLIGEDDDETTEVEDRDDDPTHDPLSGEERWRQHLVLYEKAKKANFSGPSVEKMWIALVQYAVGTLMSKIGSGEIYGMVKKRDQPGKHHWGVSPSDTQAMTLLHVRQEREDLAMEVVLDACELWMRYESDGTGYDPTRGKTLESYLVELCKDTFTNAFRRWQRRHDKREKESTASDLGIDIAEMRGTAARHRLDDQEATADRIERVRNGLRNEREQTLVTMRLAGCPDEEIAEKLGITPKAASRAWERIVNRERNK
ncbi:sigma-70 family RNA polymerase sigma factor [Mycolicibacterium sp. P1-18]|uniref:sigma-70 family RNA polymerase sigma factor n=1 Tax=Mycolicibacterium sp. P1-18 TaxID=2024615 RepID=UPI001567BEA6|nr:sigma-70 family RNA polymerase sigma factor [Mycolicibacterium sp. P1-18]